MTTVDTGAVKALLGSGAAATIALIVLAVFTAQYFLRPTLDPREPPLISPKVPIVGDAFGLLQYGISYYARVAKANKTPIFTLNLLGTKTYVIQSADLVPAVHRNHKVISFEPLLAISAKRVAGIKPSEIELLQQKRESGNDFSHDMLQHMHGSLLGPGLNPMNKGMLEALLASIDNLSGQGDTPLDLYMWCRDNITTASAQAVWGPINPFGAKEIRDAFWVFNSGMAVLLANILPRYTARAAFQAREKVVKAFVQYFAAGHQHNSSDLAFERWKWHHEQGLSAEGIGRAESVFSLGVMTNTAPGTFWTLFDIYARPDLLESIRKELQANALEVDPVTKVHTLDIGKIRDACPIILSAFQEVLRVRGNGSATRIISEDVLLDGQYLLKAGGIVQIPSTNIHLEKKKWGLDAAQFDASRFNAQREGQRRQDRPKATSFLTFGTSPNLCPGRHLATVEVISIVAQLALRYDIEPTAGKWWEPKINIAEIGSTLSPIADKYPVKITERPAYAGTKWAYKAPEGKERFGLIVG